MGLLFESYRCEKGSNGPARVCLPTLSTALLTPTLTIAPPTPYPTLPLIVFKKTTPTNRKAMPMDHPATIPYLVTSQPAFSEWHFSCSHRSPIETITLFAQAVTSYQRCEENAGKVLAIDLSLSIVMFAYFVNLCCWLWGLFIRDNSVLFSLFGSLFAIWAPLFALSPLLRTSVPLWDPRYIGVFPICAILYSVSCSY